MKNIANVIAGVILCILVFNKIIGMIDAHSGGETSEVYKNFDGMFGLKFGDLVGDQFKKSGKIEGCDVYEGIPPAPKYSFDRYAVFVRPSARRILTIRAERDFMSHDALKDAVDALKRTFEKEYRTTARKMNQDDSWAFVFLGPKNGYDKGITLVSGYDNVTRRWQLQLNAIDGNWTSRR